MFQIIIKKSKLQSTRFGVPQRSILGPLLFIVCINDFSLCIDECDASMYADETDVYAVRKKYRRLTLNLTRYKGD